MSETKHNEEQQEDLGVEKEADTPSSEETVSMTDGVSQSGEIEEVEEEEISPREKYQLYAGIGLVILGVMYALYLIAPLVYTVVAHGSSNWGSSNSSGIAPRLMVAVVFLGLGNLLLRVYKAAIMMSVVLLVLYIFAL